MERTPTPYKTDGMISDGQVFIDWEKGSLGVIGWKFGSQTDEQKIATAKFIATACNAHEELVNALKETADYYHRQVHKIGEFEFCDSELCIDNRKALAKAGGN